MIGKYIAAAVIAAACLVSGCAPVHRTTRSVSDQAKTFATLPDKAVVYVYRNTMFGAAVSMAVAVDGVEVGATGAYSFFKLAVPPGHHTIVSNAENDSTLSIDVQAGQNYYIWQDVKFGILVARTGLHVVTAEEGQAEIRKLKLLETRAPEYRMPDAAPVVIAEPAVTAASTPVVTTSGPAAAATAASEPAAPMPAPATPLATTAMTEAPRAVVTAPDATNGTAQHEGGLAVLDDRVSKPMFQSAQDIASRHQCERLLRVRSVNGADAHFYSACPGTSTPIEIACNGNQCEEAAPHG